MTLVFLRTGTGGGGRSFAANGAGPCGVVDVDSVAAGAVRRRQPQATLVGRRWLQDHSCGLARGESKRSNVRRENAAIGEVMLAQLGVAGDDCKLNCTIPSCRSFQNQGHNEPEVFRIPRFHLILNPRAPTPLRRHRQQCQRKRDREGDREGERKEWLATLSDSHRALPWDLSQAARGRESTFLN